MVGVMSIHILFLLCIDKEIGLVTTELDHAKAFKIDLLQQMFV